MSVNKIKVVRSLTDKQLDIPIELKWDFYGQEDSIDKWQEETVEKIIGKPKDFELSRFQNKVYSNGYETQVIYNFNFYSIILISFSLSLAHHSYTQCNVRLE
jgi:peptidyl-tRNA hydrolase